MKYDEVDEGKIETQDKMMVYNAYKNSLVKKKRATEEFQAIYNMRSKNTSFQSGSHMYGNSLGSMNDVTKNVSRDTGLKRNAKHPILSSPAVNSPIISMKEKITNAYLSS